jgi:hypothetical protein
MYAIDYNRLSIENENGRVHFSADGIAKNPLLFSLGSRHSLLPTEYGLNKVYPGSRNTTRQSMDVEATPELAASLNEFFEKLIADERLPEWCRTNGIAPIVSEGGQIRLKIDQSTVITLIEDGKIVGSGTKHNCTKGVSVAAVAKLSEPWLVTKDDGSKLCGVSLIVSALLVDISAAGEEPPKKKKEAPIKKVVVAW